MEKDGELTKTSWGRCCAGQAPRRVLWMLDGTPCGIDSTLGTQRLRRGVVWCGGGMRHETRLESIWPSCCGTHVAWMMVCRCRCRCSGMVEISRRLAGIFSGLDAGGVGAKERISTILGTENVVLSAISNLPGSFRSFSSVWSTKVAADVVQQRRRRG